MGTPAIRAFFDEPTNTISYLVWDPATKEGAVIDPVLDWDNRSGTADTAFADRILAAMAEEGVTIRWVLETHAHADHLTAAPYIKARTGAPIGIGEHIKEVQRIFRPVFDARDLKPEGGDFDRLFQDGERFALGTLEVEVMHLPGHTPADVAYRIGDDVFVGDTIFMHDYGTARADFPGGDAHTALPLDPAAARAAAADAAVDVPRLQGARPRQLCLAEHRRRAAREQPARQGGHDGGAVRRLPHRARQGPGRAAAAAALDPGEHPRRPLPGGRGERRALPAHPGAFEGRRDHGPDGPARRLTWVMVPPSWIGRYGNRAAPI